MAQLTCSASSISFKTSVGNTQALRATVRGPAYPCPPACAAALRRWGAQQARTPLPWPQTVRAQPRSSVMPLVENRVRVSGGGGGARRWLPVLASAGLPAACCPIGSPHACRSGGQQLQAGCWQRRLAGRMRPLAARHAPPPTRMRSACPLATDPVHAHGPQEAALLPYRGCGLSRAAGRRAAGVPGLVSGGRRASELAQPRGGCCCRRHCCGAAAACIMCGLAAAAAVAAAAAGLDLAACGVVATPPPPPCRRPPLPPAGSTPSPRRPRSTRPPSRSGCPVSSEGRRVAAAVRPGTHRARWLARAAGAPAAAWQPAGSTRFRTWGAACMADARASPPACRSGRGAL